MGLPTTVVIGDHTQGLGIVRSAAAAGGPVWVVNDKCLSLARFSRHLTGYRRVTRGTLVRLHQAAPAEQLRDTLLQIPFSGVAALFGVNEDINRFIHENRAALRARYFIPEVRLESIYDKHAFNRVVPEAARIDTRLCREVDLAGMEQPQRYLLKGRCGNVFREITGQKAIRLNEFPPTDRARLFAQLAPDQVVLQAVVETDKPVRSVCSFSVAGRLAASFGYDKLRQHPNQFGTGTYLRSVAVDELQPVAEAILRELNFTGLSEIEFIHDRESDTYRVIEMNPRAWKSVHFATQCGQNLIARHLAHLAGRSSDGADGYQLGRYWADLATDLPQQFRERTLSRYPRGMFECTWDRSDPVPALILWTLFPFIALENYLSSRKGKSPSSSLVPASA